ncbi:hypothetical protein GCM10010123_24830 [Pilimelia anulata]|uniref:WD40 repeat protein n=1 Tax=Pilimelia anulata TaxID=53371 RepID=A0A8J3B8Y2_9ACTN|nr:PD40 domain-containing protein [Pilimelia anulata]GGJ94025.1 hypothetical protein GCM10010123_24830 [Pilimelia anulata]
MFGIMRGGFGAVLATAAATAGFVVAAPVPASAATPTFGKLVAYVRDGDVWVSKGATERRITTGGDHRRPRWSPDHRRLAVLKGDRLYVMNADGTGRTMVTDRPAAGAAWSPDGTSLAFASAACLGGPGVYRVPAAGGALSVLFPAACRDQEIPPADARALSGTLADKLRRDDAVAWSPDGTRIAFRGGDCESVVDDCLTLGTIATGGERLIAGYGGGGSEMTGFAVTPAFKPDGSALAFTAYATGPDADLRKPIHLEEQNLATGASRTVGAAQDREPAYVDASRLLTTGTHRGGSWVVLVTPAGRVPFQRGSQPAY